MKTKHKALPTLIEHFLKGKDSISKIELEKLKVDLTSKVLEIGNLRFSKSFLSENFNIELINRNNDLEGEPIKDSSKLLSKLQHLWYDNKKKISWDEMKELNIYTPLTSIKIGNFLLSSNMGILGQSYSISLIDENKTAEDKWTDSSVNPELVLSELKKFQKENLKITDEKSFENSLFAYLKHKFQSVDKQVSIGGVKALKIDIDIAQGKIGLELKLAEKIITSLEKQRFIGQMHDYTTKRYKPSNFIVALIGKKSIKDDSTLKELKKLIEEKSHFVFIEL